MNKKKLPKAIRPEAAEAAEAAQPQEKAQASAATASATSPDDRRAAAEKVVERYSMYSGAAGLIPVPGVDLATVGGVQIQMLRRLSKIYDLPFSANLGKSLIAALAGCLVPAASGMGAVSLVKSVPVAGTIVAVMAMPTLSAGATYAIGMAFVEHFASGGTLLDFNPPDYRAFLRRRKKRKRRKCE